MKKLSLIFLAVIAITAIGCQGNGTSGESAKSTDSISKPDTTELSQAVKGEHADAEADYTYDARTNTVKIVKQVEVPADMPEEDYAEAIVEYEVPEFISHFKKSTKPSDVTIKEKGATITVSYVNKATGEEITAFDITPEDLK
ncbi:MAG: hypothetical protein IKX63_02075 [Muribaculaceae bacterium]|nr:hypothetical protein [Muribaculaceae bacterium]